jgi:hypothetical protein
MEKDGGVVRRKRLGFAAGVHGLRRGKGSSRWQASRKGERDHVALDLFVQEVTHARKGMYRQHLHMLNWAGLGWVATGWVAG